MIKSIRPCLLFLLTGGLIFHIRAGGNIRGVVIDGETRQPLSGVSISVPVTNVNSVSDKNGSFLLENLDPGVYKLEFTLLSYKPLNLTVNLNDTGMNLLVNMFPAGYRTPVIVVTDDHPRSEFDNLLELSYTLKDKELQMSLGQTLALTLKNETGNSN